MSDRTTKKKSAKDRLRAQVDSTVSILDQEHAGGEPELGHTIESQSVRAALRRNRQYGDLPLELIEPDPEQVRRVDTTNEPFRELVDSIREHGIIEPISVRWLEARQKFQVITGERRFRAAKEVGLETVPAIVRDLTDNTKAIHQLIENLQREDMNPIDEAKAFRRYLAATGEQMQVLAKQIGKSPAYVSQVMSLLEHLNRDEQEKLATLSPAKVPGKSLILEALRTDNREIRRAILSGELTRQEARKKVAKKVQKAGRKPHASKTFSLDGQDATVAVRLRQSQLDEDLVLQALQGAVDQQRRALAKKAEA